MLEKPDIKDERIIACLKDGYGLSVNQITFLPLGADFNTAVYRVIAKGETHYFLKLRCGGFDEASVTIPKFLYDLGIKQIIPPLKTRRGKLYANLAPFKVILYPFIKGRDAYETPLSDAQRVEFGTALKKFHTAHIPPEITSGIRREVFSPRWRERIKFFAKRIESETFKDPLAVDLAKFLKSKRNETLELVERTERLAFLLQAQPPEFILCHGDIHGWNLLIDLNSALYMVDWDTLILAPKERDLMFVGSGLAGNGHSLQEEETLFYQGYGQTQINPIAMVYYRYERIIEDIAIYCAQIFLSDEGGKDREQSLANLKSNFLPNNTIEIAYRSDKTRSH